MLSPCAVGRQGSAEPATIVGPDGTAYAPNRRVAGFVARRPSESLR